MSKVSEILVSASGLGSATTAQHLVAILNGRLALPASVGDILVASSSLSAGTVAEHLLHLQPVLSFRRLPAVIAAAKGGRMMGM